MYDILLNMEKTVRSSTVVRTCICSETNYRRNILSDLLANLHNLK